MAVEIIGDFKVTRIPHAVDSSSKQVTKFIESTNGAYRVPKAIAGALGLVAEAASLAGGPKGPIAQLKGTAKVFSGAANGLIFMRTASLAITTPEKVEKAITKNSTTKNIYDAFHDVCDLVSSACYSVLALTGAEWAKNGGDVAGLGADVIDLYDGGVEYHNVKEARKKGGTPEVNTALEETQKVQLLKLCKAIAAVAAGILGVLGLILGGPVVPAIVLLTLGVAASAFAISSHFYKENMTLHLKICDKDLAQI